MFFKYVTVVFNFVAMHVNVQWDLCRIVISKVTKANYIFSFVLEFSCSQSQVDLGMSFVIT